MTNPQDPQAKSDDRSTVDPIDKEAAHIDPRSEDAAEKIEDLIEHAEDLGRDAPQEVEADDRGAEPDQSEVLPG
ncbi:MAG: hypothetical protein ABI949_05430 [Ilumatobacteraceae bacterium]